MELTQTEFDVLLRNDLTTFIARTFAHLDPQTPYAHNWHIDLLADRLAQVYQGKLTRLIITVPPRSLKSICASVAFPAWALGKDPSKRIICASYGHELASKLARDTAAIMSSDWYQRAFATRLASQRTAAADFETTQRGGRMATSVGGVLTGRGGDIIIIDDPVKPDEALSDAQRQAANDWFDNTLYTRLNDKRTGAIVIIMQRLHLDDLVGHVLEKGEDWEVINLPAIAQENETWEYATVWGETQYLRREGELLHPQREPQEVLDGLRSALGEYAFSAQYLQAPVPLGGGIVKADWLAYYEKAPETFDTIVQSWDTANKESELADYSVCTTWGVKGKQLYLLDVLRRRMAYPDLKRAVVAQAERWGARAVLIEDKASGIQLVQELRETLSRVKGIKCEGDKLMRMLAQTPEIENGNVLLPMQAPWLPDYIQELTTFPKGKYDDQVDSTAQAIKWITGEGREPAIIQFYKMELAKQRGWTMDEVERHLGGH